MHTKVHDKMEIKYKKEGTRIDCKTGYTVNRSLHNYSRMSGIDST